MGPAIGDTADARDDVAVLPLPRARIRQRGRALRRTPARHRAFRHRLCGEGFPGLQLRASSACAGGAAGRCRHHRARGQRGPDVRGARTGHRGVQAHAQGLRVRRARRHRHGTLHVRPEALLHLCGRPSAGLGHRQGRARPPRRQALVCGQARRGHRRRVHGRRRRRILRLRFRRVRLGRPRRRDRLRRGPRSAPARPGHRRAPTPRVPHAGGVHPDVHLPPRHVPQQGAHRRHRRPRSPAERQHRQAHLRLSPEQHAQPLGVRSDVPGAVARARHRRGRSR